MTPFNPRPRFSSPSFLSAPLRWFKRHKIIGALGLLALLMLLALQFMRGNKASTADTAAAPEPHADGKSQATAQAPRPSLSVQLSPLQSMRWPVKLSLNGNVAPWHEAVIGTEINGLRIAQVLVNVGEWVQAGQVLVRFAADSVRADVAQAQAAVVEAQANAKEASLNAQRARDLQGSGTFSAQQISQYLATEQSSLARLESAKAALQSQQVRLKQTELVAPDSGLITARSASLGAVPMMGAELFRMVRQGRLEWRAEVTDKELISIQPGMQVLVQSPKGQKVAGSVRQLGSSVDANSRNALVYVDLKPHADLKAGMYLKGDLQLGEQEGLAMPYSALLLRDGQSFVMKVDDSTPVTATATATATNNGAAAAVNTARVRLQKIEIGQRSSNAQGEWLEVRSGLNAKDRVVTQGAAFLSDGDTVRVLPASSAATQPVGVQKP